MTDQHYKELPITSLCITSDRSKCPVRYVAVEKSFDNNAEIDLWKDSFFGKKTNRFICFTKEFPINNTFNVVEDIKLFDEKDRAPHGYVLIEKTEDTLEKAFQRKNLYAKMSPRYLIVEAVSDIIVLSKSKRAPNGYLLIGEINGFAICTKYSRIPQSNSTVVNTQVGYPQATPPPLPPRPPSAASKMNTNNDIYKTVQRIYDAADSYNPLQGVPLHINPIYSKQLESNNESFDTDLIDKYSRLNELLTKFHYDFNVERSIIGYSN